MNFTLIAGPLIGAIIGYCTNYIAVKMLFRPYTAKYLFGRQLPFTPGIIPKSRDRIAEAIGDAVAGNLLTQDALEKTLLAPDLLNLVRDKVNAAVKRKTEDPRLVRDVITYYMDGDEFDALMDRGEAMVAESLTLKILEMDVGALVSRQAYRTIHEKKEKAFWGRFVTEELLQSILRSLSHRVNMAMAKEGPKIIQNKIHAEFENLQEKTIGELFQTLEETGVNVGDVMVNAYTTVIQKRLGTILSAVNISGTIREKMRSFSAQEMERLTLQVAKKELGAIVNLGALIGFILGLANVLIALV